MVCAFHIEELNHFQQMWATIGINQLFRYHVL